MSIGEARYALEPTNFRTLGEAQEISDALEENLAMKDLGAHNVRSELVEIFSELVNNAAEHGLSSAGTLAHVRFTPHRRGHAFDAIIVDSGAGIRNTLARNPGWTSRRAKLKPSASPSRNRSRGPAIQPGAWASG